MNNTESKLKLPGWPWELEFLTLAFFLLALLVPFYFNSLEIAGQAPNPAANGSMNALGVGKNALSTQFGFLVSLGVVALYLFHIAFTVMENNRVTASPLHLISPCFFAGVAYYRIAKIETLENTSLHVVTGSTAQLLLLLLAVALITSVLCRLRAYRYILQMDHLNWEVISPAPYDSTYFNLLIQLRPLLYAPRRYRACSDGIIIEGWFYAMPIDFNSIHSMARLTNSGIGSTGYYYASSSHHLVRIELHDSIRAVYISPENRDEFVRYCAQHLIRRRPSHKVSPTRHGVLHASDTHAAEYEHKATTKHGTSAGTGSGGGQDGPAA